MTKHAVKSLGEIALRVTDLPAMLNFYRDVIGLELMRKDSTFAFFRIADGFEGHTQVLALFDRSGQENYSSPDGRRSTIDHLAFSISKTDFENEKQRLKEMGCELTFASHTWVKWRSLYLVDPEGNTVELVCYDENGVEE